MDYLKHEKEAILDALNGVKNYKAGRGHMGYIGVEWAVVRGLMDSTIDEGRVAVALTELIREKRVRIHLRDGRPEFSFLREGQRF